MRGFPQGFAGLPAQENDAVTFTITEPDVSWTLQRQSTGWTLLDGASPESTVHLEFELENAAALFSRGLERAEVQARVRAEGDPHLNTLIVAGIAAFFGRQKATETKS